MAIDFEIDAEATEATEATEAITELQELFSNLLVLQQNALHSEAVYSIEKASAIQKLWKDFFPKAIRFAACRKQLTLLDKMAELLEQVDEAVLAQVTLMTEVFTADFELLSENGKGKLVYTKCSKNVAMPLVIFDKANFAFRFYRDITSTDCDKVKARLLALEECHQSAGEVKEKAKPKVIVNQHLAKAKKLTSFIKTYEKDFGKDIELRRALLDYLQGKDDVAYEALEKAIG